MNFDEQNFLAYLKKYHPYLYDFEMEIRKVFEASGFGDASASASIKNRRVYTCDVSHWVKRLYKE